MRSRKQYFKIEKMDSKKLCDELHQTIIAKNIPLLCRQLNVLDKDDKPAKDINDINASGIGVIYKILTHDQLQINDKYFLLASLFQMKDEHNCPRLSLQEGKAHRAIIRALFGLQDVGIFKLILEAKNAANEPLLNINTIVGGGLTALDMTTLHRENRHFSASVHSLIFAAGGYGYESVEHAMLRGVSSLSAMASPSGRILRTDYYKFSYPNKKDLYISDFPKLLFLANATGDLSIIEFLLDRGARVNAKEDELTPLIHALIHMSEEKLAEVFDLYVSKGANLYMPSSHPEFPTVLHVLLHRGNESLIRKAINFSPELLRFSPDTVLPVAVEKKNRLLVGKIFKANDGIIAGFDAKDFVKKIIDSNDKDIISAYLMYAIKLAAWPVFWRVANQIRRSNPSNLSITYTSLNGDQVEAFEDMLKAKLSHCTEYPALGVDDERAFIQSLLADCKLYSNKNLRIIFDFILHPDNSRLMIRAALLKHRLLTMLRVYVDDPAKKPLIGIHHYVQLKHLFAMIDAQEDFISRFAVNIGKLSERKQVLVDRLAEELDNIQQHRPCSVDLFLPPPRDLNLFLSPSHSLFRLDRSRAEVEISHDAGTSIFDRSFCG